MNVSNWLREIRPFGVENVLDKWLVNIEAFPRKSAATLTPQHPVVALLEVKQIDEKETLVRIVCSKMSSDVRGANALEAMKAQER